MTSQKNSLTVVMYHYVRELEHSRFPEIKGLSTDLFKGQLDYLKEHYNFVRMEDCLSQLQGGKPLPPNSVLLTFDDGYIDHYTNVFPLLQQNGIQGSFFPPAKAILEHKVLDVNKIHFILASTSDKTGLLKFIYSRMDSLRSQFNLESKETYVSRIDTHSIYDTAEVILIKRLLQRELPEEVRGKITDDLFREYLGVSEEVFARELYVTVDQLKSMKNSGMFIGSHGYDHLWMDTLPAQQQETEVDRSLEFLKIIGVDMDSWVMCYPYGGYNDSLISVLKKKNCKMGITCINDITHLENKDAFLVPRLDTNQLPKNGNHARNEWTLKSSGQ